MPGFGTHVGGAAGWRAVAKASLEDLTSFGIGSGRS